MSEKIIKIYNVTSQNHILQDFSKELIWRIFANIKKHKYIRSQYSFKELDIAHSIFLVAKGQFEVI